MTPRDFLTVLYGTEPGYVKIAVNQNGWHEFNVRWPDQADKVDALAGQVDVYMTPYLHPQDSRAVGGALARRYVHADRDAGSAGEIPEGILHLLGAMSVYSGRPGSEHVYVPLSESVDATMHRRLCQALRSALGHTDPKISDNDLLRVVGTINSGVGKGKDGIPRPVTLRKPRNGRVWTPSDLLSVCEKLAEVQRALSNDTGNRSDDTFSVVRACRRSGMTLEETRSVVGSRPDLAARLADRDDDDVAKCWSKLDDEFQAEENEAKFWDDSEILQGIYQWARSRWVGPWALLGYTLARVVATTPPNVQIPPFVGGNASLNMFLAVVGKSGRGKTASLAASRAATWIQDEAESYTAGSGEGISSVFVTRRKEQGQWVLTQYNDRAMYEVSEVDTLAALKNRSGNTFSAEMRKAWSGERLGFQNRDPERTLPVNQHAYRLCMHVGIQPGRGETILSEDETAAGTPQRFVWVDTSPGEVSREKPPPPDQLRWRVPVINQEQLQNAGNGITQIIRFAESVQSEIEDAIYAQVTDSQDALDGHWLLCKIKVACALAVLHEHWDVREEDWRRAGILMAHSDRTRESVVRELRMMASKVNVERGRAEAKRELVKAEVIADANVDRVAKWVIRKLAEGPLGKRELQKKVAGRDRPYLNDAVEQLVDSGKITVDTEDRSGNSTEVYHVA